MTCSPTTPDTGLEEEIIDNPNFRTHDLEERGRLQFFYHSPLTELPVRDVTNEHGKGNKTEPYLERQAENYCSECYQGNNIVPFLEKPEKYLFLFTTCRASELDEFGNRYIVGYIEKERALQVDGHKAVQGPTSLYRFEDAYPLRRLHGNPKSIRMLCLSKEQTTRVLNHFEGADNIYDECLAKVEELKEIAGPDAVPPPERDDLGLASGNSC